MECAKEIKYQGGTQESNIETDLTSHVNGTDQLTYQSKLI